MLKIRPCDRGWWLRIAFNKPPFLGQFWEVESSRDILKLQCDYLVREVSLPNGAFVSHGGTRIIIHFIFRLSSINHPISHKLWLPAHPDPPAPTGIAQRPKSTRNRNPSLRSMMLSSWLSWVGTALGLLFNDGLLQLWSVSWFSLVHENVGNIKHPCFGAQELWKPLKTFARRPR